MLLERHSSPQLEVPAASADAQAVLAISLLPALRDGVPKGQVVTRQRDLDVLLLTGLELDVRESTQNGRGLVRGVGEVDVHLGNLGAENTAGVLDPELNFESRAVQPGEGLIRELHIMDAKNRD